MIARIVLWASALVAAYIYIGFPLLLGFLQRFARRPVAKRAIEPTVSVLVAAYNEAKVIESKIRNSVALDYPADRIDIAIACDGPKDDTTAIAQRTAASIGEGRVRVFAYPRNRGKLYVLNDTMRELTGEIVVFTDAASMLDRDAVRRLVENFGDPKVGAVSGVYRIVRGDDAALGNQEDLYWKYETFLKEAEGDVSSILGCHGALYAIRRDLYPYPAPTTINDDYVIPMRILQQGYRVAYDSSAVAREEAHEMSGFSRRVRIMTGNFQQLSELKALLNPLRPGPAFFFLSHKAGRLIVPIAMIAMLVANLFLLGEPFYRTVFWAQLTFYGLVVLGALVRLKPKILRLPYYFCMINAAAFLGMYYALRGGRALAWKRD
ncbi:MAG TPA: glycosyltransferase family 2 protein [Gemmatimonadaceae bacterium]|nr:glycosyltransferase family 2 protein [Gemmatimonadaceae bacterium]